MAAHRAGAGLVTLATPASIYPIVAARLTETIHLPLPESADGDIAPSAARIIRQRLPAYDALAVGCGMGTSPPAATFLRQLLQEIASANTDDDTRADAGANANTDARTPPDADAYTDDDTRADVGANAKADAGTLASPLPLPLIIDADGLNNLARIADWPALLHNIPTVLTPHPGEMATLTGRAVPDIQSHRPTVAARYAAQWKQTILLKGAHTIVATPTAAPDNAGIAASIVVSPDAAGSGSDAAPGSNTGAGTAAGPDNAGLAASIAAGPDAAGPDAAPGPDTGAGTSAGPDNAGLAASPDAAGSGSDAAPGSNTGAGTSPVSDNAGLAASPDAAGPNTRIIAGPNTDADVRQRILPFANPALAAGGAGDVLTGIIGALLAQGLSPYDAAALAGYLHGAAGEHARRRHGDAGVIASDLPPLLPSIIQDLRAAFPRVV